MKNIPPLIMIGFIGCLTLGSTFITDLLAAFYGPRDIYWTNSTMPLSLAEASKNVEVLVQGKLLQEQLAQQQLFLAGQGEMQPVQAQQLAFRFNHWHQVQASLLGKAVLTGFLAGAALAVLIVGLVQWVLVLRQKKY